VPDYYTLLIYFNTFFVCFYMVFHKVLVCFIQHAIYTLHIFTLDTRTVYMSVRLLHVYIVVKRNSFDIITVVNILALWLCCDLMMARKMDRSM
jgi:hypothetical protein